MAPNLPPNPRTPRLSGNFVHLVSTCLICLIVLKNVPEVYAQEGNDQPKARVTVRRIVEDFEAPLELVGDWEVGPYFSAKAEPEKFAKGEEHFDVTLRDPGLPKGTKLAVALNGKPLGELTVGNRQGRFRIKKSEGADVPVVKEGDTVTVLYEDRPFLRGTFKADRMLERMQRMRERAGDVE